MLSVIALTSASCWGWLTCSTHSLPSGTGGSASGGGAAAVSDQQMLDAGLELASLEGIFAAPEGAAAIAALSTLLRQGALSPGERIVVYNTGGGHKYLEAYSTRFPRMALTEQDKLGGLITPR